MEAKKASNANNVSSDGDSVTVFILLSTISDSDVTALLSNVYAEVMMIVHEYKMLCPSHITGIDSDSAFNS